MARNLTHDMLARPNHDERSLQQFTLSLKDYARDRMRNRNADVYKNSAQPRFISEHGRPPESAREIESVMCQEPLYQMYCRVQRNGQEMMWSSVADTLEREHGRLSRTYKMLTEEGRRSGSLELKHDFEPPRAMAEVDIHLQPGGYCLDTGPDDVIAGAFYEYGGNLYALGRGVGVKESKGEVAIRFFKERFPDINPTAVLDIGCSAGSSTVPYTQAFPAAEIHGIDIGPAILRYAHARAEALGSAVNFHQRDAAATGFADESFDIVASHNAMHEFSQKTTEAMMRESFRLLRPGGVAIHLDVNIRYAELDAWMQFHRGWDQVNNNEPFWSSYATNKPTEMLVSAGFPDDSVWEEKVQQLDGSLHWFIAAAQKPR